MSRQHVLISILLILGLPLLGAWVVGRDLAVLFVLPPPARTASVPPPSAFILGGMLALLICCLVWWRRSTQTADRRLAAAPYCSPPRRSFPWWGWAALVWLGVAWVLAWSRFPWFAPLQIYTFTPLWLAFIVVLNAWIARRGGAAPLVRTPRRFGGLFVLSAAFWWGFEYLNAFTQNWHYSGIGAMGAGEYSAHATIAFSTVLPAVWSMRRLLATFPAWEQRAARGPVVPQRLTPPWAGVMLGLAAIALFGLGARPDACFAWLWIAPGLGWLGLLGLARRPSPLNDLYRGDWTWWLGWAGAALACGWFWEMWNWRSAAHWVYQIPYADAARVFAMPLAGYLGYLPFGVVCGLIVDAWLRATAGRTPTSAK